MREVKIDLLDLKNELDEIASWDNKYSNDVKFRTIRKYILENNLYYSLREVINLNYEQYPIGKDERHFIHSIKNENSELIGFIISDIFDIQTNPTLYIQYIVMHPHFQGMGYGTSALNEFLKNAEKYVGSMPQETFAIIEKTNLESLTLFKNAGFDLSQHENPTHIRAEKHSPVLEK